MKKHFWLSAVELTFVDTQGDTGVTRVNTMVNAESSNVTMTELAKVQQGAQLTLFNKLGEQVTVLGLTVLNVSYLGHMTDKEFSAGATETQASTNG
jgi:hypothetical protein